MTGTMDDTATRSGRTRARGAEGATVDGAPARPNGAAPPARSTAGQRLRTDQLLSAVENELIPRLLVTHSTEVDAAGVSAREEDAPRSGPWASADEVRRFAELCIEDTSNLLNRHVSGLLSQSVGLDAVYLHLVAPAARLLGDRWSADELSFVDVQIGLCRLHQLVCECGPIGVRHDGDADAFSILLTVAPGDQHTFGVTLAADFFRRHGWRVSNLAGLDRNFLLERIAATEYSAVGFSAHNDDFAQALPGLIRTVRERSLNADILVMVGGDYFARHPERAAEAGADVAAEDAHLAIREAEARLRRAGAAAGRARGADR